MTQNVATGQQPDLALVALSVVLVADNVEPSTINPDFLRHNGIVRSDLQTEQPPVSTPVFSQVAFEGGLAMTAQPDRLDFIQQGEALTTDIEVLDMARRFLEKVPHLPYKAIGLNLTGFRHVENGSMGGGVAKALIGGGKWMAFEDVSPTVLLKAVYSYRDKQITMDIYDTRKPGYDGSASPGLLFAVNIHRNIGEMDRERRIARLMSILSSWQDDLSDFRNLVAQFNPQGGAAL